MPGSPAASVVEAPEHMTRSRLVVAVGVSGHVNVLALLQRDKLKGNSRRVDDSPRVLSATVTGPINMSHVNSERVGSRGGIEASMMHTERPCGMSGRDGGRQCRRAPLIGFPTEHAAVPGRRLPSMPTREG